MFVSLFDWLLVSLFVCFLVWSDQQIINKRSSDKQKDLPPSPKITYRHLSVIPSFRPILTLFYHSDAVPSFYYYIIILMSFQWEKARAFQSLFIATSSFGFLLIRQITNMVKRVKTKQCNSVSEPKRKFNKSWEAVRLRRPPKKRKLEIGLS